MKYAIVFGLTGFLFVSSGAFAQGDSAAAGSNASQPAKACTLDTIAFGTGVEQRVLKGAAGEFAPAPVKVFCWTKISINEAPFSFRHIWYKDSTQILEVPLRLGYASGRLWSYKTVTPGNWRVDVVAENGKVIGSGSFSVKQ